MGQRSPSVRPSAWSTTSWAWIWSPPSRPRRRRRRCCCWGKTIASSMKRSQPSKSRSGRGGSTHMAKEIITPPSLPKPRGFNHGILVTGGKLLFLAGQDASDTSGHIVAPGDVVAQFEQVLHNLEAVVTEAGGQMTDIVKLNIFVRDRNDYLAKQEPLGAVYRRLFEGYYPALALFEVTGFFQA